MDNPDVLLLIIKNRSLNDNINACSVNKLFYNVIKCVVPEQISKFYYFKRFKNRTIFSKKRKSRGTYYTLKNMYINKEEQPILFF